MLSKSETKALIAGVWTGKYSETKLPAWLFNKLADGFEGAAVKGWGKALGTGPLVDIELEKAIQENIYYFAANKTAHQLKDMHAVYKAADGRHDFVKKALAVDAKYNNHWYDTEYNATKRLARSGREWRRIEATKDLYPKLKYIAVQDGNARHTHAAIHGVIRPVEDQFWKTHMPPLDWNCRCRVQRVQTGQDTDLSSVDVPGVEPQFAIRVTDSKRIWHESHPYFNGLTPAAVVQVKKLVKKKVAKSRVKRTKDYNKARENTLEWSEKVKTNVMNAYNSYTAHHFEDINNLLRGLGVDADRQLTQDTVDLMLKNFDKTPKFEGETYRCFGMWKSRNKDLIAKLEDQFNDGVFVDDGFLSTSAYHSNAASFYRGDTKYMFKVEGRNGFAVDPISSHKGENEVLFKAGTQFEVKKITRGWQDTKRSIHKDVTLVELKEM